MAVKAGKLHPLFVSISIFISHYFFYQVPEEEWEQNQKQRKKKEPRKETITHISIHTIHLDGLRELHRHFLKLNNGAIVEVTFHYKHGFLDTAVVFRHKCSCEGKFTFSLEEVLKFFLSISCVSSLVHGQQ